MIDRTGGVHRAWGVQLGKTSKISGANPDGCSARRDAVTISKFSALVERGRACAMALPSVRPNRVSEVRTFLDSGETHRSTEIASAMINSAVEGQV